GFNIIDREGVKDYFGVYPDQVIDVLAMIGDTSDNIPGVPGIGKKGARKLIKKYGSLEKAIEAAPDIKGKRAREGLTEYGEQALHAKYMVTIKTDVPNTLDWEELEWNEPDKKELGLFFKRMEFRTLTKRYLREEGPVANKEGDQVDLFGSFKEEAPKQELDEEKVNYGLIDTIDKVKGLVDEYKDEEHFCFDTETDSPDPVT
ncbi:MAG TPA: DNA polymerase I, partial [Balneolaceae bacterium]|nr:DNA polymerase I [Balneolaceae bacterium]